MGKACERRVSHRLQVGSRFQQCQISARRQFALTLHVDRSPHQSDMPPLPFKSIIIDPCEVCIASTQNSQPSPGGQSRSWLHCPAEGLSCEPEGLLPLEELARLHAQLLHLQLHARPSSTSAPPPLQPSHPSFHTQHQTGTGSNGEWERDFQERSGERGARWLP